MKSYVFRYKKLMDNTPNNYRKMHGMHMRRWVQLRKVYDTQATRHGKAYKRRMDDITTSFNRLGESCVKATESFKAFADALDTKASRFFTAAAGETARAK